MLPLSIPQISGADLQPLWPALALSVGAIVLLISEVFLSTPSRGYQGVVSAVTAAVAGALALGSVSAPAREVFLGFGVLDPFSSMATAVVCLGTLLASLSAGGFLRERHAERGEFYALLLFSAAGMSLLAMSNELVTLFVNLEILSIATYALTAYLRRGPRPAEAGFKYFILGAFSSALLLYGAALVYGATGTTHLTRLPGELVGAFQLSPWLTVCGIFLVGAGFAFKVAAVPFHMWTPDVYEGAPTPVTGLMSAGVKAAAFAAMVRVFLVFGQGIDTTLLLGLFSMLALLTMIVGNLLALPQRSVKRMLAYSSIAHAGYLLVGVAALFARSSGAGAEKLTMFQAGPLHGGGSGNLQAETLRGIIFYLLAYTVSAIGAFATLGALERREDESRGTAWDLDRFSGLAQRRPGWAVAMAVFMLSLGGIPPTVGFMGKLVIFRSAVDAGLVGLCVAGVLTSAAGVYYYLRVVVYMFMRPAAEGAAPAERHAMTEISLALCTVAVVGLGILPGSIGEWMSRAGIIFGR